MKWFKLLIIRQAIKWLKEINDVDKKREILTLSVKHLYNAISADDILRQQPDGSWLFQGKPLMGVEVAQLKEEAQFIRGMKLWRAIKLDIKYQLGKKMFEDARLKEDLIWGQLLIYLDDIIRTRIQK